ncbi:O-antigen ligase family protein [Microbacterium sp. 22242]|uniref:O-antigen ligase family protein n=1 Tax=Microbacterium sp. 22242 TaxID=3453896 RepID=UPI003F86CFB9
MAIASTGVSPAPRGGASRALLPSAWLIPDGHSARILDAIGGAFLVYRSGIPGFPLPIPQLVIIAILVLAVFRRPTRSFASAGWYPLTMTLLLVFLAAETYLNGLDPIRRAGSFAALMAFAGFLASGRIDVGSVLKGLGLGLVLNAVLFYLHVAPNAYEGKLTGFLQDKNAAALIYAVGALLLAIVTRRTLFRFLILFAGAVAIVLTDSRTTMAAYAVAVAYLLVSAKLGRGIQVAALAAAVLVFFWADNNLTTLGDYAFDRKGSDAFRMRIDFASALKAQAAPWYGSGLGTATVNLDSGTWFFHNSYQGLIVEGGAVLTVVTIAVYLIAGLGLRTNGFVDATTFDARAITAAALVVFLCAVRLGEVFYAPIGFLVIGVGLARLLDPIERGRPWWAS